MTANTAETSEEIYFGMDQDWILEVARRARGLTQVQLAGLSKTRRQHCRRTSAG